MNLVESSIENSVPKTPRDTRNLAEHSIQPYNAILYFLRDMRMGPTAVNLCQFCG